MLPHMNDLPALFRAQDQNPLIVYDAEMQASTMEHLRLLLRQQLKTAQIPRSEIWEQELMRILLNVMQGPLPNRAGDAMDIRKYVKIKRVPGGVPSDSEYVEGVVFTKSLLNKNLPRKVRHPRVFLFDYAFEYEHDVNKIVKLENLRELEKDSMAKLVNNLLEHAPSLVLVSKGVSGLALDLLHKKGVVVARNVKMSIMQAVSRCTGAGIHTAYQQISDSILPGKCQALRVETIEHSLIPGRRKTLMRLEGCPKDRGATIVLRGGDINVLSAIKGLMRFMTIAAYSIRLEQCLLWDQLAAIPVPSELSWHRSMALSGQPNLRDDSSAVLESASSADIVNTAVREYMSVLLSTSATICYPLPYSLRRLRGDNIRVNQLKSSHRQEATTTAESHSQPPGSTILPSLSGEPEGALQTSHALTRSLSEVSLLSVKPSTRNKAIKMSAEYKESDELAEAEARRDEHLRAWENRLARHRDELVPTAHQHITVLETLICSKTRRSCVAPTLRRKNFYHSASDLPLRLFIESLVARSGQMCDVKTCDEPMLGHYLTFAHDHSRFQLEMEPCVVREEYSHDIVMWSLCRICEGKTDATALSKEAGNYRSVSVLLWNACR